MSARFNSKRGSSHFPTCWKIRVEAVVITTPTDSHQPLVLESLHAGKKVFCEKPIANDVKNVKLCYETAEKLGLPLFCAFNRFVSSSVLHDYIQ